MAKNFHDMQPGDTGFRVVLPDGTVEDHSWFVAEQLYYQNRLRIFKMDVYGRIDHVMCPTQSEWEAWQQF